MTPGQRNGIKRIRAERAALGESEEGTPRARRAASVTKSAAAGPAAAKKKRSKKA